MTVTQSRPDGRDTRLTARAALDRATEHLLGLQDKAGWWQGELETNVTMDAEDLLLREFLGIRTDEETEAAARWIRSRQRADGTWSNWQDGTADLSTTVEAYVALRLAGDQPGEAHMTRAAAWITGQGGIPGTRVFTRIWLALFGAWSWDYLPVMPPEMIYLPAWFPLNVYDWGCWARQTIVPLTVVGALRPARPLPFTLDELYPAGWRGGRGRRAKSGPPDAWDHFFNGLDRVLHGYVRRGLALRPAGAFRRAALRRCAEWIIARQERDGCWGGIQPPWVYSLIALHLLGYGLDHPVIKRGLAGLDRFTIWEDTPRGPVRRLEACQSPVWDTVLAMIGLSDAGLPADHPALQSAAQWVLDEEIRGPGDWQVQRPGLAPGGWAFEFDNDGYPDIDDTAEVVLALRRAELPGTEAAVQRALRWLTGMQSKDGGWGAFDADNTSRLPGKLPFCDFGEVIDPPSADVTAHTVEALAVEGLAGTKAARRGVAWLLRAQESDGSWFGRWGANYIYGTGAVVPALIAAGVLPHKPSIRRAVAWLISVQNSDGGWGEDLLCYEDPKLAGRGPSTASQTAWALMALLAAGGEETAGPAGAGVRWLARTQRDDGTWDEPQYTGTGFPCDFYINYHLYRLVFPVTALGRYLAAGPPGGPAAASRAAAGPGPAGPAGQGPSGPAGSGPAGRGPGGQLPGGDAV
ncbi:MAG TPA: squalene--hopene cyclase [Streptosporangiaceae bacterium]|jgi:squalene-hopene/tetraprenyl-beta-curcumene cyclase